MRASCSTSPPDCRVSEALRRKTPRNDACWACLPGRFHFSLVEHFHSKLNLPRIERRIASGSNCAESSACVIARTANRTTPFPPKLGALKFGWLRMLKNSDRNCKETRSVIWNALNSEKSKRWNPGPTICPGLLPKAAAPVSGTQFREEPGSERAPKGSSHPTGKAG